MFRKFLLAFFIAAVFSNAVFFFYKTRPPKAEPPDVVFDFREGNTSVLMWDGSPDAVSTAVRMRSDGRWQKIDGQIVEVIDVVDFDLSGKSGFDYSISVYSDQPLTMAYVTEVSRALANSGICNFHILDHSVAKVDGLFKFPNMLIGEFSNARGKPLNKCTTSDLVQKRFEDALDDHVKSGKSVRTAA